jgi:hypothetical protein
MHKSWSQLLLIMLVPSAQAVADNPIFYRVVVFNGVLHSNEPGSSVGQNLAIWPRVSAKGDGLRFRFCGEQTVIGTTSVSPSGLPTLGDLRGAAWRIGTTDLPTLLPLPAGAIGSVASDRTMTDRPWAASSSHQATLSLCRLPHGRTPMPISVASRS